jgi:uncharacterized membrane protein
MATDNIRQAPIQVNQGTISSRSETMALPETFTRNNNRISSVDFLRGMVMIIMALDHVRGYLHFDSFLFSPTDLQHTTPALFGTRVLTHLCAPTFILLAGTSTYFVAQRKGLKYTSFFLVTRGLWLIVLQFTLIRFAWNFDPLFHYNSSNIISTIGFCMIGLAALIHLRLRAIFIIGLLIVFEHNTLDKISFEPGSTWDVVWSFLHVRKLYLLENDYSFLFLYPFLPWVGVMMLGYCLGSLYNKEYHPEERKPLLLSIGCASLCLFLLFRWINYYGDPVPWTFQDSGILTIMSFLNVEKYPPSLLFLTLTLGLSISLLAVLEGKAHSVLNSVSVIGKVPMFYYVMHIFVIHIVALVLVCIAGYPWQTMIFVGSAGSPSPLLKGKFGLTLGQIYFCWMSIILLLFPLCGWWLRFKTRNKNEWWVSYV